MNAPPNLPAELQQQGTFLGDLARSLVGDPALADDLNQEAWMARWQSAERDGSPTDPTETRRWLSTVLRRGVSNARRSGARRSAREAAAARPESVSSSGDAASRMEIAETLLRLVRQLEEPSRTAIIARFYEGLSYGEIGAREDCPPSTVRSRVERGLNELRQRLDREPSGGREAWLGAVAALAAPSKSGVQVGSAGWTAAAGWAAAATVLAAAGVAMGLSNGQGAPETHPCHQHLGHSVSPAPSPPWGTPADPSLVSRRPSEPTGHTASRKARARRR